MSVLSEAPTISGTTSPARELTADSQQSGGFTAVNGAKMNGLKRDIIHVGAPPSEVMHSPDGGYRTASNSPESPGEKRKRTPSESDESEQHSPKRRMSPHGEMPPPTAAHAYPAPDAEGKPTWYPPQRDESEARLAEALQRETHQPTSQNAPEYQPIRSNSERTSEPSQQPTEYNGTITTAAGVQVDPKKRKRVFANRTKTGCQTCRRRKKKCDEAKPECQNCLRGGFVCEGYAPKHTWTKSISLAKGPSLLLAPQDPTPLYARPQEQFPRPPSQQQNAYGTPTRPIAVDEEQETPSSRTTYSYEDGHRPYNERPNGLPTPDSREPAHRHDPGTPYRPTPPSHPVQTFSTSQSAVTAQLALQHATNHANHASHANHAPHANHANHASHASHVQPRPPSLTMLSEKEKMLRGEWYRPFSADLVLDRESCQAALWKFNNNSNPTMGLSRAERLRIFRDILRPPHARGNTASDVGVEMGDGVCIDAPFNCEYGYNISLGHDVVIGANCRIQDPCKVRIGDKCILGPDVKIMGNSYSSNPVERNGSAGMARGKPIIIEENVLIGPGVIIMDGVRIGRNCTIGPGKIVKEDLGEGSTLN